MKKMEEIFPIKVNQYDKNHFIFFDEYKFDLIKLLCIEDKDDMIEDFFINKCYGTKTTRDKNKSCSDDLYDINKHFIFNFTIIPHMYEILLDNIIIEYQYELKEDLIKKFEEKNIWTLYEFKNTMVFFPNNKKEIGKNKILVSPYNAETPFYVSHIDNDSLKILIDKLNEENYQDLIFKDNQGHGIDVISKKYGTLFSTGSCDTELNEYFVFIKKQKTKF